MKKKLAIKIVIIMLVVLFAVTFVHKEVFAITPGDVTGEIKDGDIELGKDFIKNTTDLIRKIGAFLAVGVMMVIGIKYMTGSLEEKANYKKTMMPYITRMYTAIWSFDTSTYVNRNVFRSKGNRRHWKHYIRSNPSSWNSRSNSNTYDARN